MRTIPSEHPPRTESSDPSHPGGRDRPVPPPGPGTLFRRARSRHRAGRHPGRPPGSARSGPTSRVLAVLLILLGAAGCSGEHTIPPGTRLIVELEESLEARPAAEGSRVEARLAGNLTAEGQVLLPAGTRLTGRVTRVQEAMDRWPAIVKVAFDSIRVRGVRRVVDVRIVEAEVEPVPGDGAAESSTASPGTFGDGGMAGEIVQGRRHAPLVRPETREGEGSGILLGTPAAPARLPAGARLELELRGPVAVPAEAG